MCVVAVLISYCSWGLISSSVPRGLCVVFILLFMGKMAKPVKMEKSLNFSSTAELLFWLSEHTPPPTPQLRDRISIKFMFIGMWKQRCYQTVYCRTYGTFCYGTAHMTSEVFMQ